MEQEFHLTKSLGAPAYPGSSSIISGREQRSWTARKMRVENIPCSRGVAFIAVKFLLQYAVASAHSSTEGLVDMFGNGATGAERPLSGRPADSMPEPSSTRSKRFYDVMVPPQRSRIILYHRTLLGSTTPSRATTPVTSTTPTPIIQVSPSTVNVEEKGESLKRPHNTGIHLFGFYHDIPSTQPVNAKVTRTARPESLVRSELQRPVRSRTDLQAAWIDVLSRAELRKRVAPKDMEKLEKLLLQHGRTMYPYDG